MLHPLTDLDSVTPGMRVRSYDFQWFEDESRAPCYVEGTVTEVHQDAGLAILNVDIDTASNRKTVYFPLPGCVIFDWDGRVQRVELDA